MWEITGNVWYKKRRAENKQYLFDLTQTLHYRIGVVW